MKRTVEFSASGTYIIELTKPDGEVKDWHISFLKQHEHGLTPVFDAPISLTRESNEMGIIEFKLDSQNLFIEAIPHTVSDSE